MKIIQLIPNLSGGGGERFVVDLCNELSKKHEVHLITLYNPNDRDIFRKELSNRVAIYSLNKKLGFDIKVILHLYKAIKKIQPQIIHSHLRSFNYLMAILPLLKFPIVHTIHSDAFRECANKKIRNLRNHFFKKNSTIPVTISDESNRSFEKAYTDVNAQIITNGRSLPRKTEQFENVKREIEDYKFNDGTKVFLHIGRMHPIKNQVMLVRSFLNFISKAEDPNAILVIISGVRENSTSKLIYKKIKKFIEENKASNRIYLLGQRPTSDYYHLADYFCLSSIMEGMPMTLIEAFATGTISICTAVGGMTEMVKDIDPKLLSSKVNKAEYTAALHRAYNFSDEEQKQLKEKAYQLFEDKYSIAYCADEYQSLYNRLVH